MRWVERTVSVDEGGEGEVEGDAELLGGGSSELGVAAVLDGPDHESGEAEEGDGAEPEAGRQRLQEDPHVPAPVLLHRHDHRHPRLRVRQREVHILAPVRDDRYVPDRRRELLLPQPPSPSVANARNQTIYSPKLILIAY